MRRPKAGCYKCQNIAEAEGFPAVHAHKVQSDYGKNNTYPRKRTDLLVEYKERRNRNKHCVKTGYKACFAGISGQLNSELLKCRCRKKEHTGNTAADKRFFLKLGSHIGLFKEMNNRYQRQSTEQKANTVKGECADIIRADSLCDKGKAPYYCGSEQNS